MTAKKQVGHMLTAESGDTLATELNTIVGWCQILDAWSLPSCGPGAGVDDILLETGDHFLLESGDALLME